MSIGKEYVQGFEAIQPSLLPALTMLSESSLKEGSASFTIWELSMAKTSNRKKLVGGQVGPTSRRRRWE